MEEKWPDLHLLTSIKLQFSNTLHRPQAVPSAAAHPSVHTPDLRTSSEEEEVALNKQQ